MTENVLVVGSGGREHAIAWKIMQSKLLGRIYVAPGNGGTQEFNVPIKAEDLDGLCKFAKEHHCFTVVGPEVPLSKGIVDRFSKEGLSIFGPTMEAAKLETSKLYAKKVMSRHSIPTAKYATFEDAQSAIDYAYRLEGRVAVKVDGLAGGKGVFVCKSEAEAESAIRAILEEGAFGQAGSSVVIEERLEGPEMSLMNICDGKNSFPFGTARDHKRAYDTDRGPNTGGMGAFSPIEDLEPGEIARLMETVVEPVVNDTRFRGFLYVGLMLTEKGPKVLEFNARLGDPEAQAILPRLQTDFLSILISSSGEDSHDASELDELAWSDAHCCTVVMCSEGYPHSPRIGDEIRGIEHARNMDDVILFHSGTAKRDSRYFTNGGRVLSVTGMGKTRVESRQRAYGRVDSISWRGEFHRRDIAFAPRTDEPQGRASIE